MAAILSLKFTITGADGVPQPPLSIDAVRAVIGSGAHCEIRLPPSECPVEQLVIEARNGAIFGAARCLHPPALLNGAPFSEGRILPESVLQIGATKISVVLGEATLDGGTKKASAGSRPNPLMYALALVALGVGGFALITPSDDPAALAATPTPPSLFGKPQAIACPQQSTDQALAVAGDELALAESKRERSPFRVEEGVAAIAHYRRAAACLRRGSAVEAAREADQAANDLTQKIESDFHIHTVRLERALATKEYERARTEIRLLLSYLRTQPGEYSNWLTALDRRIQLKYSGQQEGAS